MAIKVYAVERPDVAPRTMSDRFWHEITYFMSVPGAPNVPPLGEAEFWVPLAETQRLLDDGVFLLVSPLDSENKTEVELSEEHEGWLEWMLANAVERIRLDRKSG